MAYDKVVDSSVLDAGLTAVANAIRTKTGKTGTLEFPSGMASAIGEIAGEIKTATGTFTPASYSEGITVSGLEFEPKHVVVWMSGELAALPTAGSTKWTAFTQGGIVKSRVTAGADRKVYGESATAIKLNSTGFTVSGAGACRWFEGATYSYLAIG